MKRCSKCHKQKEEGEFLSDSRFKDGRKNVCADCLRGVRTCTTCSTPLTKENSYYYKSGRYAGTFRPECKYCNTATSKKYALEHPEAQRNAERARKYGVLPEDFEQIFMNQDGKCAICQNPFIGTPHLDHDHAIGKVRGLLCRGCNHGLGHMQDSPERLRRAADYLERK